MALLQKLRRRAAAATTCALLILLFLLYNNESLTTISKSTILLPRRGVVMPKESALKYIYQYTSPDTLPFAYMERGQSVFIKKNCAYQNCYVTSNKSLLGDVRLFDAVLFHVPELRNVRQRPARRTTQKFVFVSIESSHYYPVCNSNWDNYFNWTWSYRLDSDVAWGYITVHDEAGRSVAPAQDVAWLPHHAMAPVTNALRDALRHKRLAAAWLVSNCHTPGKREVFVEQLQLELDRFGLRVDVWGRCGQAANSTEQFLEQVERDYYFYLSFENSFSSDYVTEKLRHATMHFAVPVVFGGANYTRFLPPHSFLDARALGAANTARIMRDLIADPIQYAEYHRWRSHYSYHSPLESPDTDPYCGFCKMMNSDEYRITTVYPDIRDWWKGGAPDRC